MVKDAEANKAADDKRKEDAETRNKATAFIDQIDQTLENKDVNVDENQKAEVKKLRDELQTALDNNDMDTLKNKLDELEKAAQAMSAAMYQQQAQQAQASPNESASQSANNDNVVDADFTEKN